MFRHELKKAEAEFKKLIGKFELVDNYYDNFDGMHENNKESILEVQFTGDVSGGHSEYNVFAIHLASFNAIYNGYAGYEEAYPSKWLYNTLMADKTVEGKHSDRAIGTIIFDDPDCRPFYYERVNHSVTIIKKVNTSGISMYIMILHRARTGITVDSMFL